MARPTKLDPAAVNLIVSVLQRGLPIEDACEAAGIVTRTFENWMNRGKRYAKAEEKGAKLTEEEQQFLRFFRASRTARATGKVSLVETLNNIALKDGHPKQAIACMWLLERMHPKQFGRKYIKIESSGPDGGPIEVTGASPIVKVILKGTITEAPEVDLSKDPDPDAGEDEP